MKEYQSLSHIRWNCKCQVVFIPMMRKKQIFGVLRQHLGEILLKLAKYKGAQIVEGHLMGDRVHICISIPLEHAMSNLAGLHQGQKCDSNSKAFWRTRAVFH